MRIRAFPNKIGPKLPKHLRAHFYFVRLLNGTSRQYFRTLLREGKNKPPRVRLLCRATGVPRPGKLVGSATLAHASPQDSAKSLARRLNKPETINMFICKWLPLVLGLGFEL